MWRSNTAGRRVAISALGGPDEQNSLAGNLGFRDEFARDLASPAWSLVRTCGGDARPDCADVGAAGTAFDTSLLRVRLLRLCPPRRALRARSQPLIPAAVKARTA